MEASLAPPDVLAGPLGGRQLVVARLPVDDVQGDLFQACHNCLALKSTCRHLDLDDDDDDDDVVDDDGYKVLKIKTP